MKKINLICFPFAGGSIYSYDSFTNYLNGSFNLITMEYPGRGSRIREALLHDMDALVEDVFASLEKSGMETPYVIYGHSMGAIVGYQLVKKVLDNQLPGPLAMFFTGAAAPSAKKNEPIRYNMSREKFIENLIGLGGSPDEIIMNPDFMEFYEPILRADFEVFEKYEYKETSPINIPMYSIIGLDENITPQQALLWKRETIADFEFAQLPGKHFFILDHTQELISYMQNKINNVCQNIQV